MYEVVDGGPFVHGAHPGRAECGGRGLLDGVILAGWRTGARVQVVFQRYLAIAGDAQLRGRTREQDVFRGNHPRRARPEGLSVPQARTRAPNVGPAQRLGLRSALSQRALTVPDSSRRYRNCSAVDRTRSACRQATHRSSGSQDRPSGRSTDAGGHSPARPGKNSGRSPCTPSSTMSPFPSGRNRYGTEVLKPTI